MSPTPQRLAQVQQRRSDTAKQNRAQLNAWLQALKCAQCGRTGHPKSVLGSYPSLRSGQGHRPFSDFIGAGYSFSTLHGMASAALAQGNVVCRGCEPAKTAQDRDPARVHGQQTCTKCGQVKRLEDFPYRNKAAGVRQTRCRPCAREDVRASQAKRRERETSRP